MQDSDSQPVTRTLLALNIAMFVVETVRTGHVFDVPARPALELGASYAFATVGESRWETLLTACFLHSGIVHLGFNMLALWLAGPEVERAVGSARMAPMYLVAGAFGNLLGVEYNWITRSDVFSVGASGAISGVLSAALVVGLRTEGRRSPLAGEMALWLGFVLVFGLASSLRGGRIDNAAHLGGAVAGALIASGWRLHHVYSRAVSARILAVSGGLLVGCIALVAIRDRTNPFAGMLLQDRHEFTLQALADGRCGDAQRGLLAVEHLRASMAKVELRSFVEGTCGHVGPPALLR